MAVYFIRNPENGLIKIGKSMDVKNQVRVLSLEEGAKLELLGVIEGYTEKEWNLHEKFNCARVKGKWFNPIPSLSTFISDYAFSIEMLDAKNDEKYFYFEVILRSKVAELAKSKGIKNPIDLHWPAGISWPVAKKFWAGDISNMRMDTGRKVARALGVSMDDLFDTINE